MSSTYNVHCAGVSSTSGGGGLDPYTLIDGRINACIASANDLRDLSFQFEDAVCAKRRLVTPNGGQAYSILSNSSVSMLSEKIMSSGIWNIPVSNLTQPFHMSEKAETGIFVLSPRSKISRVNEVNPLGSNLMVKVNYTTLNELFDSRVEINVNKNYPILDTLEYGLTVETDNMLVSMARLTADVLRNASTETRIWERLFGISVDYNLVNTIMNEPLHHDLIETLSIPMVTYFPMDTLNQTKTIGQLLILASHARMIRKVKTLPRLHHVCLAVSLAAQVIRDVASNTSRAAALTPIVTWLSGQTCFDCAIHTCTNFIPDIRLRLYPTGISEKVNLSHGLLVKVVPIMKCSADQYDIIRKYRHEVPGMTPISSFGNHTLICVDDLSQTADLNIKESPFFTAQFRLDAMEVASILVSLDYVINFARSLIRDDSSIGGLDWFNKNFISTNEFSHDLHNLVTSLYAMSLKYYGSLANGCLMLATNLAMRTLVGIDTSIIKKLATYEWMHEIARQVFLSHMPDEFRISCLATREVVLSSKIFRAMPPLSYEHPQLDFLSDYSVSETDEAESTLERFTPIDHPPSLAYTSFAVVSAGTTYFHPIINGGIIPFPPPNF